MVKIFGSDGLLSKDSQVRQAEQVKIKQTFLRTGGAAFGLASGLSTTQLKELQDALTPSGSEGWDNFAGRWSKEQTNLTALLERTILARLKELHDQTESENPDVAAQLLRKGK